LLLIIQCSYLEESTPGGDRELKELGLAQAGEDSAPVLALAPRHKHPEHLLPVDDAQPRVNVGHGILCNVVMRPFIMGHLYVHDKVFAYLKQAV
jgi:hypothetical protein